MINLNICTAPLLAACVVCLAAAFYSIRILCIVQLSRRRQAALAAAHILSFTCLAWSITRQLKQEDGSVLAAAVACITLGCSTLIFASMRFTYKNLKRSDTKKIGRSL